MAAVRPDSRGVRLALSGVSKVFGENTDKPFRALQEIDLELKPSEFVSVVGPSGCGKSTLMLMAAGLLEPTTGEVSVDGQVLTQPMTDIGIAFQDHLLLDFRTARENVLLQADIRGLDRDEIGRRADVMFAKLGLTEAASKYPKQLSGGMRQRVAIARSLVHRPSMLMFDEPFGALDALTRIQVRADLEQLWLEDQPTVLFITHSVDEAVNLSDRVIVMSPSPGRIVDDIPIDLPRPRPLQLRDNHALSDYVDRIFDHFERMGVLHEVGSLNPVEDAGDPRRG